MRQISADALDDIARGAAVLGTGGGGDPYIGKLMAQGTLRRCGEVDLLDPWSWQTMTSSSRRP